MNIINKKLDATNLRKEGYSLLEIAQKLHIAKSTASIWLRNVELPPSAKIRLNQRQMLGQQKAKQVRQNLRKTQIKNFQTEALNALQTVTYSPTLARIFCALLWWCEGNKNESFVRFTSSDETLIKNFLSVFRSSFSLDEKKFRALVHIHSYHDDLKQKTYWSQVTRIPLTQFHRSFQKANTGKRKHDNYQGCVAVTYYDAKIAKELEGIYNAFTLYQTRGIR